MALLSQALHLGYLLSPHSAFQGHAAHTARWPAMLSPNGSSDTCIADGVFHIPMPCFHGAIPVYPQVLPHSSKLLHGAACLGTTVARAGHGLLQPWSRRAPPSAVTLGPRQRPASPSAGAPGTTGCATASGTSYAPQRGPPCVSQGASGARGGGSGPRVRQERASADSCWCCHSHRCGPLGPGTRAPAERPRVDTPPTTGARPPPWPPWWSPEARARGHRQAGADRPGR
jgi:hypothetical protein